VTGTLSENADGAGLSGTSDNGAANWII